MKSARGYTITELIVAIAVSTIMVGVLYTVTFRYYVATAKADVTTTMALESQSLLTQLTDDIRLATGIGETNAIDDPNGPGGGWMTNDPSNILIVESPATDSNRDIIYDSLTGYPYTNEFVYFSDGSSMYKRTLKNEDATGNTAKTTCPQAIASGSCPADRLFTNKLENLTFVFYDANDAVTTDSTLARSVELTVSMSKDVYGQTLELSNSTRVTLRNQQ